MEGFEGVDFGFGAADFPAVHAAFDLAGGEVEEGEAVVFVGGEGGLEIEAGGGEGRGAAGGGGPAQGAGGEGAGEDGVDRVRAEVLGAVAGDGGVGEGVEVAGEEDGGAVHAGGGEEEAVVLGAPAGLPEVLGAVDAEAALVIEDVGVPFAPFAGGPGDGHGGDVDDVAGGGEGHAAGEPVFDVFGDEVGVGSFEGLEAAAIVEEEFDEVAGAEGAVAFTEMGGAVGGGGAGEAGGAVGVGEVFGEVEVLGGAGEAEHEVVGGEGDAGDGLGVAGGEDGFVVFEVVVVVLDEVGGDGAEEGAVEVGDLAVDGGFEEGFVGGTEDGEVAVEVGAEEFFGPGLLAHGSVGAAPAEAEVPVDVVADGDHGVGLFAEGAGEEAAALGDGDPVGLAGEGVGHGVVTAGAGVDEEAEVGEGGVGRG